MVMKVSTVIMLTAASLMAWAGLASMLDSGPVEGGLGAVFVLVGTAGLLRKSASAVATEPSSG